MIDDNFNYLKSRINQEGFHYCFKHYSNWENIKDPEFHKLRISYLEISKLLEDYIERKKMKNMIIQLKCLE
jgi:hypothetical protein